MFEAVTKVFERPGEEPIRALSELSLEIEDKECLGIVGPSGSGKTTALRLIAGLETPTSGTILIGGKVVNGVAAKERDVAMVFQSPALYPHMSVYENLGFGLKIRGCSKQEINSQVREVAQMLGVSGCLGAKPSELSGGQRQRVAIGRALVRRPSVLLLDEPLANVDPTLRAQMRNEICRLRREFGTTMIYVTHDHLEALMMGDRVAVLREGILQQVAEPGSLYGRPANVFVAEFIGSPPMNLFHGVIALRGTDIYFEEANQSEASVSRLESRFGLRLDGKRSAGLAAYAKKEVLLGVRPEQITCALGEPKDWETLRVRAKVIVVQTTGPDKYVRARFGANEFVARAPSMLQILADQEYGFVLNLEHACFFDPATGKALL